MSTSTTPVNAEKAAEMLHSFHQQVGRVFSINQTMLPPDLMNAFDQRVLLSWPVYAAYLFTLDSTIEQRRQIKGSWNAVSQYLGRLRRLLVQENPPAGTPAIEKRPGRAGDADGFVPGTGARPPSKPPARRKTSRPRKTSVARNLQRPLAFDELHADTELEFAELLAVVQARSGLSIPQLAAKSGIPRSQMYSMLRRGKLPTRPEQVEAMINAAGLPNDQVQRVMTLWSDLKEAKSLRDLWSIDARDTIGQGVDPFREALVSGGSNAWPSLSEDALQETVRRLHAEARLTRAETQLLASGRPWTADRFADRLLVHAATG